MGLSRLGLGCFSDFSLVKSALKLVLTGTYPVLHIGGWH